MGSDDEKIFRTRFREASARVAKAFDDVDPDIVECEDSLGSLTLLTPKGKIIVSPQPPVRQLWLAAASQGIAAHFDWDEGSGRWLEDKHKDREFFAFLAEVVQKASGFRPTF